MKWKDDFDAMDFKIVMEEITVQDTEGIAYI